MMEDKKCLPTETVSYGDWYAANKDGNMSVSEILDKASRDLSKVAFNIAEVDQCQLSEGKKKTFAECEICKRAKNKIVKTRLICTTCNVFCCAECYDCHRKEQLISNLGKFKKQHVAKFNLLRSGEFLEPIFKVSTPKIDSENGSGASLERLESSSAKKDSLDELMSCVPCTNFSTATDDLPGSLSPTVIKTACSFLKEVYGVISEVLMDQEGKLKCMYFQDSRMKDFVNFYPHRICIDVTCKLIAWNVILCLFICEDSNGQHEIVSVSLISMDDVESLIWLLTMFKKHNPCWRQVRLLIVDSLIQNRDIVKQSFPDAHIKICFYHATRTFKRDLNSQNFCNIPEEQKANMIRIFEAMALTCNEMEYNLLLQQLYSTYDFFQGYFEKKWHAVRHEWQSEVEYCENILYAINSYLKYVENSIKPILSVQVNLCELIQKFFFLLKLARTERSCNVSEALHGKYPSLYSQFTVQYRISKFLTPYAAEFVIRQLDISSEININPDIVLDNYIFCRYGITTIANAVNCTCNFFILTSLFCCHIFAVRRVLSLPAFDESLCGTYWTQNHYATVHETLEGSVSQIYQDSIKPSSLVDKVAPFVLHCNSELFSQRISFLNQLVSAWESDKQVFLQFDGFPSCPSIGTEDPEEVLADINSKLPKGISHEESQVAVPCTFSQTDIQVQPLKIQKPDFLLAEGMFNERLLQGNEINFAYLSQVICKDKDSCIQWLQLMHFLPNSMSCPSCGCDMKHASAARLSDGVTWICTAARKNKKSCAKRCTVRRGTWFEGTNMSLQQILYFTYMWVNSYPPQQIIFELGISSATFTVWDKYFQRVCSFALQQGSIDDNTCEEMDVNSRNTFSHWFLSKNGQDVFVAFLNDASLLHEKEHGSELLAV